MASEGFLRDLPDESASWASEGLVTTEQAERIRARYPSAKPAGDTLSAQVLYATAGVLLGAAGIALVVVGLETESAFPLLGVALALLAAGAALHFLLPARRLLSDALFVAAMTPLAFMPFPEDARPVAVLAILIPAALLAWRRARAFVHVLGVVAFSVGSSGAAHALLEQEAASWLWLGLQLLLLVALVLTEQRQASDAFPLGSTIATPAAAISAVLFLNQTFPRLTSVGVEVTLGAAMLTLMIGGVLLQQRGMALGASIVLGVDAIVFAFDFGGVFLGTGVLVALAALLILQAEGLKRFLAPANVPAR